MQESIEHSNNRWIFKALIGLYTVNIIMHAFFMGLSLHGLIFEPLDEFILLTYLIIVLPLIMFFAILIMVFNHLKNKKGVWYENYLFMLFLLLGVVVILSMFNIWSIYIFQVTTVVLFLIGIVMSIGVIRNLVAELRISRLIK